MWASSLETFLAAVLLFLPQLVSSLIVFALFWLAAKGAVRIIARMPRLRERAPELTGLLGKTAEISLLLFGAVTALGTLGIHVAALVTGLGLTGFAAGFALKDIISNALSGILIILSRPFRRGDRIMVIANSQFTGVVIDINLRYTVLDCEQSTIFVPNSILFTNAVTVHKQQAPTPPPPTSLVLPESIDRG